MNEIAQIEQLPTLVQRAANRLASATNAAEILSARELATVAYDAAKLAGRLEKARGARDELIVKAAHAQADALEIEAQAKRLFAIEYSAAQKRGEVQKAGGDRVSIVPDQNNAPSTADLGISRKDIMEGRRIDAAESADPGFIRRTINEEPTRAALRRAIETEKPAAPPAPQVAEDSLWLWGRLRDFERGDYFTKDPRILLNGMSMAMRDDVRSLLPLVREFLEKMEIAANDHP